MKPAGAERDREILIIRFCNNCAFIKEARLRKACDNCLDKEKAWSTDISEAIELAREMHLSGQKDADRLLHEAWNYWMAGDDSSTGAYADAISGAWLKWKEG